MKKLLCLLLCLVMCLACLAGCKKDKEEDETTDHSAESETSAGILVSDLINYSVIYPENTSKDVETAAKSLANAINEKFSTTMNVKNDYFVEMENSRYTKGEYEILVGETNREETATYLDTLLYKDYGYALVGKKLVITGNNDEDTVKAVEAFIAACVTDAASDATVFFDSDDDEVIKGEYLHGEIKVGDTNLSEYRIVYPAGSDFEKSLATKITYSLAEACGVFPTVVADSEAYADGYEILIGKTNRSADLSALNGSADGAGYVAASGKFVVLAGNSAWGNATAVNSFIKSYETESASDSLALSLANKVVTASAGNLTTMSFNVGDGDIDAVVGIIVDKLPDTVGLQEVADGALTSFKSALGGYYEFVGTGENVVLFAKDKLAKLGGETVTVGATWSYTWVTVQSKSNSADKFMHINTKLDEASASTRQEQAGTILDLIDENAELAIVVTGDFGCAESASELKLIVSGDMANASSVAGSVSNNGSGDIDEYVLIQDYYMDTISYARCSNEIYGVIASDSCPIVVEFKINYSGTEVKEEISGTLGVGRDNEGDNYENVEPEMNGEGYYDISADATTVSIEGVTYTVVSELSELPKTAVAGGKYILANDIDCGGATLAKTTIVLGDNAIFDGNGYSILNFKLSTSSDDTGKSGLFELAAGGTYTIRNITFGSSDKYADIDNNIALRSDDDATTTTIWENVTVYMNPTRDGGTPGAFISSAKGTHTFKYCNVYLKPTAIATSTGSNFGGFVGNTGTTTTLTFEYCNVYGNSSSINNIGGYIGYVAHGATISFTGCTNYANITATGGNAAGGFIGYQSNNGATVTFTGCVNYGTISHTGATNVKESHAGGFIGYDIGTTTYESCINMGSVNAYGSAGGFVGSSTLSLTIKESMNKGSVSSTSDASKSNQAVVHAGGFVGKATNATFEDCTNIGKITLTADASDKQYGCGNLAGYVGTWSATGCYGFGTLVGANATKGVLYGVISDETGTSQDNKFVMNSDNNENMNGAEAAGRVTVEGATELLASRYEDVDFVAGDSGTPVIANPEIGAVQKNGTTLRLVGVIDTLNFGKAGFKYTVGTGAEQTVFTAKALGSVSSKDGSTSAEELGGAYAYACVLDGVLTDGEVVIKVVPVAVVLDENGATVATYEGSEYTLTFTNGVLISVE